MDIIGYAKICIEVLKDTVPPDKLSIRRLDEAGELVCHSITLTYPWKPSVVVEKKWVLIGRRIQAGVLENQSPEPLTDKAQVSTPQQVTSAPDPEPTDGLKMISEIVGTGLVRDDPDGSESCPHGSLPLDIALVERLDQVELNSPSSASLNLQVEISSPITPPVVVVRSSPAPLATNAE
ncbi:hypothetical protein K2173_012651 [Erythroxylum novogranatense]|uniref:Uncharacterized protein n=1 Tax=Erythroxylum novogranatense TaxID=1862640 RepID=A0AAV8TVT8_9ROSI|nr:hypothetical protein K2173_012651 [Erythroxylum novogranatense]